MNLRKRPTKDAAKIDLEPKQPDPGQPEERQLRSRQPEPRQPVPRRPEPRQPEQRQLRQRQPKPRQQEKTIIQKKRKSMDPTEILREKLDKIINRPSLPFHEDVIRYIEQFHAKHPNVAFECIDSISK